ncbi:DUF1801 domain-containing protein [Aquisalinus flavus]|uniref:YdhG-like domain-containing protein n=1 Tax=Aquisalinus flavus TaxID=1526572 RepID=A0A8J2V4I6_9PROT|nr:DUF1801 domain-containing protein [Aquisalinus flavus]MBD0427586.1 DUF1801 domain-containing protein [Aquisalinus flavus]UNE47378.1 DUF1801 domain-containing protein [Aquisalinus flavus]GGD02174.1 hypothetical protein GCM10011342_09000 [Aquisalinus flavus]
MAKSENKTKPTGDDVIAWLEGVDNATRRQDAFTLLAIMKRVTGCEPVLWGPSIIGFDQYHYTYDSGREGDWCLTGFSPRKGNLAIYLMGGFDGRDEMLARLGKYKTGKSCLYVNKLADIDMAVLEEMIVKDVAYMRRTYH